MGKKRIFLGLTGLVFCSLILFGPSGPAFAAETLYEDAEDGDTLGWSVYDQIPSGATITNIYDSDRESRVIELAGDGTLNGYLLRDASGNPWNNSTQFIIEWSMKCSGEVRVFVDVETDEGHRFIYYTPVDTDNLGTGEYVHHGLGSDIMDGQWHTFVRDLDDDLEEAQSGNSITEVNGLYIRGSGRLDDIKLWSSDTIFLSIDDIMVYEDAGTAQFTITASETSGSPITVDYATIDGTAVEPDDYTSTSGTATILSGNTTVDVSVTIVDDTDQENDESFKLILSDPNSGVGIWDNTGVGTILYSDIPASTLYEDAEDGDTLGWSIYDNEPSGATVSNVYDTDRGSRVIELSGDGTNNGYWLQDESGDPWNNWSQFIIAWRMKCSGEVRVFVDVETDDGQRFIYYTPADTDNLGTGTYVHHGLGSDIMDGEWHTFARDLEADLEEAQPGVNILEVNGVYIRGSARLDDIELLFMLPFLSINDVLISEDAGPAVFTITVSETIDSDITVDYDTVDGTAEAGSDYVSSTGTATLFAGMTSVDVSVSIIDDTDAEGAKSFFVTISNPFNAGILDGIGEAIIEENDPSPTTVYEDAQDGDTLGWSVYDNNPSGAIISNVYDTDRGSRVIELSGDGTLNGYWLQDESGSPWDNSIQVVIEWSMKCSGEVRVFADVETNDGQRYIFYTPVDYDGLSNATGEYVHHGLGSNIMDGQWHTFRRDLNVDLKDAQPGVTILEVNGVYMRGSARVDDIKLLSLVPLLSIDDITVSEDSGSAIFTITASETSGSDMTVVYTTVDDTAQAGSDYVGSTGTATILAGTTSANVSVAIMDDTEAEGDEAFFVNLSDPTVAGISGTTGVATITGDYENEDLIFTEDDTITGTYDNIGTFRIDPGVTVTADDTTTIIADSVDILGTLTGSGHVYITGNDFILDSDAKIDLDGAGCPATQCDGPGKSGSGYQGGGGAGHGREGGDGTSNPGSGGPTYGSAWDPRCELGSGGGNGGFGGVGGAGGGALAIEVVQTCRVDGEITVDGLDGTAECVTAGGGGSGGSVYIKCETFTGTGEITADGGDGGTSIYSGGGGGGGRIAIYYDNDNDTFTGTITVEKGLKGGPGAEDGEDGTIVRVEEELNMMCECEETRAGRTEQGTCVNLTSGNAQTDLDASPVKIYYNSVDDLSTMPLGPGWTHTFNQKLFPNPGGTLTLRLESGGRVQYHDDNGDDTYESEPHYGDYSNIVKNVDNTYTLTKQDLTALSFDTAGNLTEIQDRNGNQTTLTYISGKLTKVTDPYGREINFQYSGNYLTKVIDPAANETDFVYDGSNRLIRIEKDSGAWKYEYTYHGSTQLMETRTDPEGNVTEFEYNAKDKVTKITDPYSEETKITYDELHRKTSIKDRTGNTTEFTYDLLKDVILKEKDPLGNTTTNTFDEYRNHLSRTNPRGATATYTYNKDNGNLLTLTNALGHITSYQYGDSNTPYLPTLITDPKGVETLFEYDTHGNKTKKVKALGTGVERTTIYEYYTDGNLKEETLDPSGLNRLTEYAYTDGYLTQKVIDPSGLAITYDYEYDVLGNLIKSWDPNGNPTQYGYDYRDNRTLITDPLGVVTKLEYLLTDDLFRRTEDFGGKNLVTEFVYDGLGRLISTVVDPSPGLEITTLYYYDAEGRKTRVDGPGDAITEYEYYDNGLVKFTKDKFNSGMHAYIYYYYDANGNGTSVIDANSHYTYFQYDELDRVKKEIKKIGDISPTLDIDDIVTQYEYDMGATVCSSCCGGPSPGSSNISKIIDPNGKVTYFKYDDLGRKLKTIKKVGDTADVIDSDDWVESLEYDLAGNVLTRTDANGNATTFTYDANNRMVNQANALAETTTYTYDDVGNVTSVTHPGGNVVTSTYSARNELTDLTDSIGQVASYTYDNIGNRETSFDGNGNGGSYGYDAANRLITEADAMGETTYYEYDDATNLIKATDREDHVVCYQYDDLNRRTLMVQKIGDTDCGTIDGDDIQTTTEYDNVGNVTKLTDANSIETEYDYDEVNRLIKETYADSTTKEFTHDFTGNMLTRKDNNGDTTTYTYDDLYRLAERDYPGANDDTFTYDVAGRMLTSTNNDATITYTYDDANRVLSETLNGKTTAYAYDIPARTRTVTYPSGREIVEHLNMRQLLDTIEEGASTIADYTYDLGNRITLRSYPLNGTSASFSHNANNWVTDLIHNPTGFVDFNYDFDDQGNRLYEEKVHRTTNSEHYTYDDIYRLTKYKEGTLTGGDIPSPLTQTQYNYDDVGNRMTTDKDGTVTTYNANTMNEYTSIVDGGTTNPTYDGNGNLTDDGTYNYAYDYENRLISVNGGATATYKYDALARRIQKVVGVTTTSYYFDGTRVIEERNGLDAPVATYVYGSGMDEVLTMDRGGSSYYLHQNSLGSVVAVTDSSGTVVERYEYDGYGKVTIYDSTYTALSFSAINNPYMFTGRCLDLVIGLYYYRARHYDPGHGRFIQRDPNDYTDGMNLYSYAGNNPVNHIDPTGRQKEKKDEGCSPTASKECRKCKRDNNGNIINPVNPDKQAAHEEIINEHSKLNKWCKRLGEKPKCDANSKGHQVHAKEGGCDTKKEPNWDCHPRCNEFTYYYALLTGGTKDIHFTKPDGTSEWLTCCIFKISSGKEGRRVCSEKRRR